ncbi:MAG: polysaccharide biosynthesis tyrosine autokinase [Corynebacterium variabile]|uniref:polysaccharide biosynthesis tyrosine autokinase n=1 Tax=Corynebacterium variabile TaxID=1727 RepID=UPI003F8DA72E
MSRGKRVAASSPLVTAVFLGFITVCMGMLVRPEFVSAYPIFDNDAGSIRSIMSSPFTAEDLGLGSFSVIANFYESLGLADSTTGAGLLGTLIGSIALGAVVYRVKELNTTHAPLILAAIAALATGVFQATYTKEVLISLGMIVIILLPVNLLGEILVLATMCVLGAQYRSYWLIIAGLYVVLRILLAHRRRASIGRTVWLIIALSVLTGLALWVTQGVPADNFRSVVNDSAERQFNTGSLISRFFDAPEPLGGVLNTTLTSLFFIIPLPMLLKLSPYYLAIGIIFLFVWINVVWAASSVSRTTDIPPKDARLLARYTALPLAFLIVQGLFEPDWGSALRHVTPLMPLVVGAAALTARYRRASTGDPPPMTVNSTHNNIHVPNPRPTRTRTMAARPLPADTGSDNVVGTYLSYLRKLYWIVIIGLVAGLLVGWGASSLMTKQYTATAQLYVGTASTGGSGDAYQGALLAQKQVGSYAEMADGRALAQRVVDELNLDMTADEVAGMISAGAHKDTVILDIHATSADAKQAQAIANSASAQLTFMVDDLNTRTSPTGESSAPRLAELNAANVPSSPSSPNTGMNIVLGGIIGLILGILVAVTRGMTDNRIRTHDKIEEIAQVPSVGIVSSTRLLEESHVIDFRGAPTPVAEQFRELRTNLRFLDVDNAPSIIAVTSGMLGEGKSTVATNLALALADDGERVCLVDADLRRPCVATYLPGELQGAVGLSTALSGEVDIEDVVQETAVDGLAVVTAGAQPPNPSELLGSKRFRAALEKLDAHFDYVIVDASPVLPVTDGALVAATADGVLLVVRHASSTTDQLTSTTGNLGKVDAHLLGTIFTLTPSSKKSSSYGYGYGYGEAAVTHTADTAEAATTQVPVQSPVPVHTHVAEPDATKEDR